MEKLWSYISTAVLYIILLSLKNLNELYVYIIYLHNIINSFHIVYTCRFISFTKNFKNI